MRVNNGRSDSTSCLQAVPSIADLERLEIELRSAVEDGSQPPVEAETPTPNKEPTQPANESYIGEGSGINVIESIFSNPRFQPQLLKHLLARPRIQQPQVAPAALPSVDTARFLFTTYLHESHVQKPFFMESEVVSLLERIYSHMDSDENTAEDLFNFYLICATSAVPLRRRGRIQEHPYSFFLAARSYADSVNLLMGIPAVQSLLLLARFGVYFHTGASTWEIGRVCMSICISLELHLNPLQSMSALEEQRRRRVFWESYVLDRHTSMILGRPFAIADEDIEVQLPAELSDAELSVRHPGTLDMHQQTSGHTPSPMAVFICFVKLRQITSRIHTTFFSKAKKSITVPSTTKQLWELGNLYEKFQGLLDELNDWRQTVPSFFQPDSLYQRPQWYEFLCEKERLFLVRAMINAASSNNKSPPKDLCRICCASATGVISLYAEMYWARQINCTRHYFQILLTAGLFLAYFTSGSASNARKGATPDKQGIMQTLVTCSKILHGLAAEMLDARPYATVFDLICETAFPGWKALTDSNTSSTTLQTLSNGQDNSDPPFAPGIEGTFTLEASTYNPWSTFENGLELNDFSYPDSLPSDWTYSPGQMFADVEAYVNQFATGDFSTDALLDPASWNVQPDMPNGFG
ncbi:hypothetical protein PRZ48_005741 [Zasmidium cellare]|uniref:Xylanolytic transcriptional activator regulatory domain-containing protein n=1 Tax=Zasmidium cellare TaxID=395010 RepID=A0ABR0EM09_ZASCE|nr:hypothetical protein PRZ48_005741 [Zasmidium cellare]